LNRRALVLILVALALFLIAATIKSGWLYLVAGFLLSLVLVGILAGWRTTRRLELERECPAEVFEREPFPVRLRVSNRGRLARNLVTITDLQFAGLPGRFAFLGESRRRRAQLDSAMRGEKVDAGQARGAQGDAGVAPGSRVVTVESIDGGASLETSYLLSAPRRGVYENADIVVGCGGVFGSAGFKHSMLVGSPVTVFPGISWIDSFPLSPMATAAPAESYEWSRRGIGQDYYGVREYTHGDSLRHIHWRSSARQGRLIVKEYQHEVNPCAALLVLLREPSCGDRNSNSLEDGLRAAASIVRFYTGTGSPPVMVVPGDGAFIATEQGALPDYLRILAAYKPEGSASMADLLYSARQSVGPGRAMSLVTNLPVDEVFQALVEHGIDGLSLVLVLDESYGPQWDGETVYGLHDELAWIAPAGLENTFLVTGGREIGECLSVPLSTIAL